MNACIGKSVPWCVDKELSMVAVLNSVWAIRTIGYDLHALKM